MMDKEYECTDIRNKNGKFAWVKKLLQPKSNSRNLQRKHRVRATTRATIGAIITNPVEATITPTVPSNLRKDSISDNKNFDNQNNGDSNSTKSIIEPANESNGLNDVNSLNEPHTIPERGDIISTKTHGSKSLSIAQGSIKTSQSDNFSTIPLMSLSTISVISCTFSENSIQSTSNTFTSEHHTLFTNSSTIGIPPDSILDRRDNRNNLQLPNINGFQFVANNNSNGTINTGINSLSNTPTFNEPPS